MVQDCKVMCTEAGKNLHSERRCVCIDANAFMRFRTGETHLRWPSQVTLSPPKAKLRKGHWQRWWVFAAETLQCCCGHPSFWISKQHSVDFDRLIPAWSSIPFLTIPPHFYLLMETIHTRLRENFACLPSSHCQSCFSQLHEKKKLQDSFSLLRLRLLNPTVGLETINSIPLCPTINLYHL